MTPEQQNIIRSQARKCSDECKKATAGLTGNKDPINRAIIKRHYSLIEAICQPFSLFLVTIGRVNGTLKDR
jgi:hypothetical protein